jgi:hypothetical protein
MTGNQFGIINDTSVFLDMPIRQGSADNQALQSVEITGNQLYGQWGIRARNVGHLNIGSNHYSVSVGMVKVGRCYNVGYVPGNLKPFPNPSGHILYENETADELSNSQGNLQFNFTREFPADNQASLYDLSLSTSAGCLIVVESTGAVAGSGQFATRATRYASQNSEGNAPNLSVVSGDFTSGNLADINWVTSADKLSLQAAKKEGSGSLEGIVRLSITGPVKKIVQR